MVGLSTKAVRRIEKANLFLMPLFVDIWGINVSHRILNPHYPSVFFNATMLYVLGWPILQTRRKIIMARELNAKLLCPALVIDVTMAYLFPVALYFWGTALFDGRLDMDAIGPQILVNPVLIVTAYTLTTIWYGSRERDLPSEAGR